MCTHALKRTHASISQGTDSGEEPETRWTTPGDEVDRGNCRVLGWLGVKHPVTAHCFRT